MQVEKKQLSDTKVKLTIAANAAEMDQTKQTVLERLNRTDVKLQGFRKGKAPLSLVEKQVDPNVLQTEFLDALINKLYTSAIAEKHVRPVERPEVTLNKFVPFTTLEFEASVEAVGEVTLPDYKNMHLAKKPITITDKQVDEVLESLQLRGAERKAVERPAAKGDEVLMDFTGTDAKSGEAIKGADGKNYPLVLGSDSFIPGFEDNLLGLKAGDPKTFELTFPKDYGVKALQNKNVQFAVTINTVNELAKPEVDDAFAAKVGPFKTVTELKADIKKQLTSEQQYEADRAYENQLIENIADKSTVAIPKVLVDEEIGRMEAEERQNVLYRGQTWQEHLAEEGVSEEDHREQKRAVAERRVKASLVLSEIAEQESVDVTAEELEIRMQILKGQYQDKAMQAELDKPETRREIAARLGTEKTIQKLTAYASA